MRALLLEVENAGQHRALGFVQFPVRVRVHYERPQFTRRMRGDLALYRSSHPDRAADQIRNRVYHDHERRQDPGNQPHDRNGIFARQLRMLAGDSSGDEFAQYYMKEHSQSKPGRPTDDAQADSSE